MAFGLRSKTFILKPFLRILDAMGLPMLPTPMNPTETAMVSSFARGRKEGQRFPLPETGPSIAPDSREFHRAPRATKPTSAGQIGARRGRRRFRERFCRGRSAGGRGRSRGSSGAILAAPPAAKTEHEGIAAAAAPA